MAKEKKKKEPQYIRSPLNNPMINYRTYVMSGKEKSGYSLLCLIAGGLVGLVFFGGLFKVDGEASTATYISNAVVFLLVGLVAVKFAMPVISQMLLVLYSYIEF